MPFRTDRKAATADDNLETEPKREFERWRVAVEIILQLREAGVSYELRNGKTATDTASLITTIVRGMSALAHSGHR